MKFYRYKPITRKELEKFLKKITLPPEIVETPTVEAQRTRFKIKYTFTPNNPFGKTRFHSIDILVGIDKKWRGNIKVYCLNPTIQETINGFLQHQFKAIFDGWDRESIDHGNVTPDDMKRCGMCLTPGKFPAYTCNSCTNTKKIIGRMRPHLPNYKTHSMGLVEEMKRIERRIEIFSYLYENTGRSDTAIAKDIIRGII